MDKFDNIVLNIPHSSISRYGEDWLGVFNLFSEVKRWTDWHTDLLFKPSDDISDSVRSIIFPYSRFYCDVERLYENEPLEAIGQGIVYDSFNGFRKSICDAKKKDILDNVYIPHIELIKENILMGENSLLIDCHSFPSDLSDIDICIGYNTDWSKPSTDVLNFVVSTFESNGYKVGLNNPYSNSLSPYIDGKTYSSFMIEVNKKCYMYEDNLDLREYSFTKLQRLINKIYLSLLK